MGMWTLDWSSVVGVGEGSKMVGVRRLVRRLGFSINSVTVVDDEKPQNDSRRIV